MAFFSVVPVLLGLAALAQPTCEQAPVLPELVSVHVAVQGDSRDQAEAVKQLRAVFACYESFTLVDDSSDADIDIRVMFRSRHPENVRMTHQMAVSVVGRSILPGHVWVGEESWADCGHSLVARLIQLLTTPAGPRGSGDGSV